MATIKQRRALELLAENGGNVSKAMRDAGYSPQTAKTPQKLTESPAFIELMNESGITDMRMLKTLSEGLDAVTPQDNPDWANRHKYLETAIKLKGYGKEDNDKGTINIFNNTGASTYIKKD